MALPHPPVFIPTNDQCLRDQHGLVLAILQHVMVSVVTDGEDVGRHFTSLLSFEHLNHLLRVDGKTTVRIDGNTEKARVGLEMIESSIIIKRQLTFNN